MEYRSVTKIHQGNFITRYDIEYMTENGLRKDYEMISRDPGIDSFEGLRRKKTDAVVMVIHDESGERILLNREYRMATGQWIFNFPAGLIDPGETAEALTREYDVSFDTASTDVQNTVKSLIEAGVAEA